LLASNIKIQHGNNSSSSGYYSFADVSTKAAEEMPSSNQISAKNVSNGVKLQYASNNLLNTS